MAGGGDAGLTDSILVTPTWMLSVVFFILMLLSFTFELSVHHLKGFFLRRGKRGTAEAIDRLVLELTLLGFVSLLLTAFSGPLGRICVPFSSTLADWTLESNIDGCPCCMKNTHGLSLCTQVDHECLTNATSREAYCDCDVTDGPEYANAGWEEYVNQGLIDSDECRPFELVEAQFFLDTAVSGVATIADKLNISLTDVCADLSDGVQVLADYNFEDGLAVENEDDSTQRRRRLLGGGGGGGGDAVGETNPLEILLNQNYSKPTQLHLMPRLKVFKCTGPFLSSACPDGQVLLISETALHQMHIWLFLVAVIHVTVSVIQILLGSLRLMLWRRWERRAQEAAPGWTLEPDSSPSGPRQAIATPENGSVEAGKAALPAPAAAELAGTVPLSAEKDVEAPSAADGAAAAADGSGGGSVGSAAWATVKRWCGRMHERWRFRRPALKTSRHWLAEAGICLVQALSPNTVTRYNYLIMRQAWLDSLPAALAAGASGQPKAACEEAEAPLQQQPEPAGCQPERSSSQVGGSAAAGPAPLAAGDSQRPASQQQASHQELSSSQQQASQHPLASSQQPLASSQQQVSSGQQLAAPSQQADFLGHLVGCLESDLPAFVGLSIEMWLVACSMLLLSGLLGWMGALFLTLAAALLFATNVALVALLRQNCRGGQPHRPRRQPWWRSPKLLLSCPIRLILFLCSFVFSSMIFFVWQFGAGSCFFSDDSNGDIWGLWGLPWWSSLIMALVLLLWTSLVTIPTFSLVIHPHIRRPHHHTHAHSPGNALDPGSCGTGHLHAAEEGSHGHGVSWLVDAWSGGVDSPAGSPKAQQRQPEAAQQAAQQAPALPPAQREALLAEAARLRERAAELERSAASLASSVAAAGGAAGGGAASGVA